MKKLNLYIAALATALTLSGCSDDFLEQTNTHDLSQQTFFESDEAVEAQTAPLYNTVWYTFNDIFYYSAGDGRSNNITAPYSDYIYNLSNFTENSGLKGLPQAWGSLYSVVAQSNNAINNILDFSGPAVTTEARNTAIAEARFMRGLAYWYIASMWGCAIIYTNTGDALDNYVVSANPLTDVIEFSIRDLEFAAKYLPKAPTATGRLSKYAAYGMLSRIYLSMAGLVDGNAAYDGTNAATEFNRGTRNQYYLELAEKAAWTVISESNAKLLDNYGDLFAASTQNNNAEVLFQLQFMQGAGVGGAGQSMSRYLAWSSYVSDTNAWGGSTFCSFDLWEEFKEYADQTLGDIIDDAIRRHHSVASYGEEYPELSQDPTTSYIYGVTEELTTFGNQGANIKKYVIGNKKANGFSEPNNSGINTYMLRLAEVYLNYVEAVMGNNDQTTDATALEIFNKVRTRAQVPTKNVVTWEDLRHEFRVELAFEGLYWFQLLRRSYYQQQEVINYMNNQCRNATYYDRNTHIYSYDKSEYNAADRSVNIATATYLVLPMPDTDQTKNPKLKQDEITRKVDTVPYSFGEKEVSVDDLF